MNQSKTEKAADPKSRRLYYYNAGFFTQSQVRRIIELSGYELRVGTPQAGGKVAVWGKSPTSHRGEKVADVLDADPIYIEDAFLRSIRSGRSGEPPMGLTIDRQRPYFDAAGPSDLEDLLATAPFDNHAELERARRAIEALQRAELSKYNDFPADGAVPAPGFVLVVDQTHGDASVTYGNADKNTFREMLYYAQEENPGAQIVVKSHPDTIAGHRAGYFDDIELPKGALVLRDTVSPFKLFEHAARVYTVSSGLGFEAIFAGHKPIVFGQPFYTGWGLTDDRNPVARRKRTLTRRQLFLGAMIQYPVWYDAYRDCLCEIEDVIANLGARARAFREDIDGFNAMGMRRWKRPHLKLFFSGADREISFAETDEASETPVLFWGHKDIRPKNSRCVEDGFLRSKGLGADLVPPLSLVADRTGIYYDPNRPCDLESLINASVNLPDFALERARKLRKSIVELQLSKYGLQGGSLDLSNVPESAPKILVVGQVEDDVSVLLGATQVRTNTELLERVRADNPDAYLIYKPHPDVEAGLRTGSANTDAADMVASNADPIALLGLVDQVATISSTLGFEALLRQVSVTCYGVPFYAGWGLTSDQAETPDRRMARPNLDQFIHATLIDYPRYFDPETGQPCPPEIAVLRLSRMQIAKPSFANRVWAKLKGFRA